MNPLLALWRRTTEHPSKEGKQYSNECATRYPCQVPHDFTAGFVYTGSNPFLFLPVARIQGTGVMNPWCYSFQKSSSWKANRLWIPGKSVASISLLLNPVQWQKGCTISNSLISILRIDKLTSSEKVKINSPKKFSFRVPLPQQQTHTFIIEFPPIMGLGGSGTGKGMN